MLALVGAQGSTTPDFELAGCHASLFVSGALFSHGSGCSVFVGGFVNHGSLNCDAAGATLPFPLAVGLFCSQPSFDDPDATDGEWLRATQVSTLLAPAKDGIGCLDIAPVFVFHGSVAGDARPPHGSEVCNDKSMD